MASPSLDFSSIGGKPVQSSAIDFSSIGGKPVQSAPSAAQSTDLEKQLHQAYDNRPLLRKVLGLEPSDLSPELQNYLTNQKQQAQKQVADQLQGVYSGYKEGAIEAAKMAPFIPLGGVAGKAAELAGGGIRGALAAAGTQAAGGAAITKAEGGSNTDAALSGGIGAAGELVPLVANPLKDAALGQYKRALAPTTKVNKAITSKIAPEMMDRGIYGSLDSIQGQAAEQANALRPQLKNSYASIPAQATQGSGDTIVNALEGMKNKYIVDGKVANPSAVNAISGVQDIVKQYGSDVSPESLRKLKQIFDDPVAAQGGYSGADLTTKYALKAQQAASNRIRSIINTASPDTAALDKEVSFWLNVKQVAGDSAMRQTGQAGGLLKTLGPLGVAAASGAGLATHGAAASAEGAALTGVVTAVGIASRSARWRTASALLKNNLADALASGDVSRASALLMRLGVAAPAAIQSSDRADQTAAQ